MLNRRQYMLYDLLKTGKVFTAKEIMEYIRAYGVYDEHKSDNDNSTAIRTDLLKVNEDDSVMKILTYEIVDSIYYFSAARDYEQAFNFAESVYREKAIKALMRYSAIITKCRQNGQGVILSKRLDLITEKSKAEKFIESYVKGEERPEEKVEEKVETKAPEQLNLWGVKM